MCKAGNMSESGSSSGIESSKSVRVSSDSIGSVG